MKLVRYARNGAAATGVVVGEDLIAELAEMPAIDVLIRDHVDLAELALAAAHAEYVPMSSITLMAPLDAPEHNIFCVGLNYRDHIAEGDRAAERPLRAIESPVFFTKSRHTIAAPEGPIPYWRAVTQALDYEIELAVVIGRGGRDISREAAMDHVFGYCIANDITARDLQRRHGQWYKGKSLDGSLPLGPWLVTRDEIGDVPDLALTLTVDGEVRQQARTTAMIFDIPALIAELSAGLTLSAGDILLTGTPAGVGFAMNPPRYLRPGNEVVCTIERLGELRNYVVSQG
jgi:2-keto-4-pentenoate hydratase/2-oxohepta-3-ene-1,7-dioic acid hydratase in catechol pathway